MIKTSTVVNLINIGSILGKNYLLKDLIILTVVDHSNILSGELDIKMGLFRNIY